MDAEQVATKKNSKRQNASKIEKKLKLIFENKIQNSRYVQKILCNSSKPVWLNFVSTLWKGTTESGFKKNQL